MAVSALFMSMAVHGLTISNVPSKVVDHAAGRSGRALAHHTRSVLPQMCADEGPQIPESAFESIPPGQLADAWRREEKAKELGVMLKGCSLYVIGNGAKKSAVGSILAKRLSKYRFYDVPALVCSTYTAVSGGKTVASMGKMCEAEPLDDVAKLNSAVMSQVQAYARSVITVWEGAVETSDFAIMQQGLVINLDEAPNSALSGVSEEQLASWRERHRQADVTLEVKEGVATDDVVFELIEELIEFIQRNPSKNRAWKAKADEALAKKDADGPALGI
mmetsp:Transcript_42460/g.93068  ORF Transcript_42460/g.93068 Transcript_42460/m.93068 type:complete len:276 (-) Transcript_42460:303-1130(-)